MTRISARIILWLLLFHATFICIFQRAIVCGLRRTGSASSSVSTISIESASDEDGDMTLAEFTTSSRLSPLYRFPSSGIFIPRSSATPFSSGSWGDPFGRDYLGPLEDVGPTYPFATVEAEDPVSVSGPDSGLESESSTGTVWPQEHDVGASEEKPHQSPPLKVEALPNEEQKSMQSTCEAIRTCCAPLPQNEDVDCEPFSLSDEADREAALLQMKSWCMKLLWVKNYSYSMNGVLSAAHVERVRELFSDPNFCDCVTPEQHYATKRWLEGMERRVEKTAKGKAIEDDPYIKPKRIESGEIRPKEATCGEIKTEDDKALQSRESGAAAGDNSNADKTRLSPPLITKGVANSAGDAHETTTLFQSRVESLSFVSEDWAGQFTSLEHFQNFCSEAARLLDDPFSGSSTKVAEMVATITDFLATNPNIPHPPSFQCVCKIHRGSRVQSEIRNLVFSIPSTTPSFPRPHVNPRSGPMERIVMTAPVPNRPPKAILTAEAVMLPDLSPPSLEIVRAMLRFLPFSERISDVALIFLVIFLLVVCAVLTGSLVYLLLRPYPLDLYTTRRPSDDLTRRGSVEPLDF